jgi:hypothetical protein
VTESNESHGLVRQIKDIRWIRWGGCPAFLVSSKKGSSIMAPVRNIGYVARRTVLTKLLANTRDGSYSLFSFFPCCSAVLGATTTLNSLFIDWGRSHGSEFFRD